ncbi:DUF5412 family protein [Sediminibacillus terrae]|uniref:DUF5412 family protein n=1 Tax=Sediminibacillus terrae TaxID=1562106 RepID=UPI001295EC98|nr:DUF5412 family protein [Sediminibacillus terrae]
MNLLKKHKFKIILILILGIFLFWIRSFIWGPINFEQIDVSDNQVVYESDPKNNEYSIKVYYYKGPMAYFEYSYIGSLYKDGKFVKNIFWISPSGNDLEIEWLNENTVQLHNVKKNNEGIKLNILRDKYDFR